MKMKMKVKIGMVFVSINFAKKFEIKKKIPNGWLVSTICSGRSKTHHINKRVLDQYYRSI